MALAALIVAIVAIVIAGVSAFIAWQAKNANVRQALAAEAVVHDAREPDIGLVVEMPRGTTASRDLVVTHRRGPDLTRLDLEIVLPPEDQPRAVPVPGFYPGVGIWTTSIDGLRQGHSVRVPVNINPHPPPTDAVFLLRCHAGGEEWPITCTVTPDYWGPPLRD